MGWSGIEHAGDSGQRAWTCRARSRVWGPGVRVGCLRLLPTSGHGAWARQGPSSLGSAAVWESCGCSQARRGGEAALPRPRGRGSVLRGRGRGLRGDLSLWLAGPLVCGDLAQVALRGPSSPAPWKRLPRARDRVCTRVFGSRESRLLLSSGRRVMRSGTLSPRRGPEKQGRSAAVARFPRGPPALGPRRTLASLALPRVERNSCRDLRRART